MGFGINLSASSITLATCIFPKRWCFGPNEIAAILGFFSFVSPNECTQCVPLLVSSLLNSILLFLLCIIPVDNNSYSQDLLIVEKDKDGKIETKDTIPVRFVPLVKGKKTAE